MATPDESFFSLTEEESRIVLGVITSYMEEFCLYPDEDQNSLVFLRTRLETVHKREVKFPVVETELTEQQGPLGGS